MPDGHRGAENLVVNRTQSDPRVTELGDYLEQLRPQVAQIFDFASDVFQSAHSELLRLSKVDMIREGRIIHAIPMLNWYRVQIGEGGTTIGCAALGNGSFTNIGVRPTSPYGPNSRVLVFLPRGVAHGYILGTMPEIQQQGTPNICDWIVQGSNAGVKRDDVHNWPIKALFREGGALDFSNRRPVDGTAWEWGMMSESGIAVFIDSFQAFLRVNEACGLFLNYWDSYTRLAGVNLDVQSNVVHDTQREDEGENQRVVGHIVYPWEAVGCYARGTKWTHEFDDDEVHNTSVKGKIDLADGEEDLQPVYRLTEYGGYLGQPLMRILMAPEKQSGKRRYADEPKDYGLWQEVISLEGGYAMRSAKSIFFARQVIIPVPKQKRLPEDQKEGDDAREANYKPSGEYGTGGDKHKVGDVQVTGTNQHLRRVTGVLDLLAHKFNWQAAHPFHYHKQDYKLWQEAEMLGKPFDRMQDELDFGSLGSLDFMVDPQPKKIKIDGRYGQVNYYQRESLFALHEDGSVQIACGYGSQIAMVGGNLIFDCPGSILFMAGKRVVQLGWDVIFRAKNSMDFSATNGEVRFKSEKNMQFISGNGGSGGMLFESKTRGQMQSYQDKYGEDVRASGIVFLAEQSQVGILAKDIYARTGGGGRLGDGNITLDAGKGNQRIVMYGKHIDMFANKAVQIWHEPMDENPSINSAHRFAATSSIISGKLIQENGIIITKGELVVKKGMHCAGALTVERAALIGMGVGVGGAMAVNGGVLAKAFAAQNGAPFVGPADKAPEVVAPAIASDICAKAEAGRQQFVFIGSSMFESDVLIPWYNQDMLGNNDTIEPIGFSFRDPPDSPGRQYRTQQFMMPEPRWMQLQRMGMGKGGIVWTEKPVVYNGQETYPWPGKEKWTGASMATFQEYTMVNAKTGVAKDRPDPYETPTLGDLSSEKPNSYFKTVL